MLAQPTLYSIDQSDNPSISLGVRFENVMWDGLMNWNYLSAKASYISLVHEVNYW